MPPVVSGGFAYYSDPAEFKAAFDAYQGGGPYPAYKPAAPTAPSANDILLGAAQPGMIAPGFTGAGKPVTDTGAYDDNYYRPPSSTVSVQPVGKSSGGRYGDAPQFGGRPISAQVGERPFWMNYSNDELMKLSPQALASLPPEAFATMPNDVFVNNPGLLQKLTPEQIQARGFGLDFQYQQGIGEYRPQEGGIPTYQQLQGSGVVPPRVQTALAPMQPGQRGVSPYAVSYESAGIRRPSSQTYGAMNPTDREATMATFQGVGLEPADVLGDINRSQGSQMRSVTRVG